MIMKKTKYKKIKMWLLAITDAMLSFFPGIHIM